MFIWKPGLKARGRLTGRFSRSMGGHLVNTGEKYGEPDEREEILTHSGSV